MDSQVSYPTATAIGAVLALLAPAAAWLYSEFRGRWRERLKADFELLRLCREAEAGGAQVGTVRSQIEESIQRRGALFVEHGRYDWTYAGLALFFVVVAVAATVFPAAWLSTPLRGVIVGFSALLLLGAVLNFFGGEPQ